MANINYVFMQVSRFFRADINLYGYHFTLWNVMAFCMCFTFVLRFISRIMGKSEVIYDD